MGADELGKKDITISAHGSGCILANFNIYDFFLIHGHFVTFNLQNDQMPIFTLNYKLSLLVYPHYIFLEEQISCSGHIRDLSHLKYDSIDNLLLKYKPSTPDLMSQNFLCRNFNSWAKQGCKQ